jgi:hypothetical protein
MPRHRHLLAATLALVAAMPATATGSVVCGAPGCTTPVSLPFTLPFSADAGGVVDRDGRGTGFTLIDESSRGSGLVPSALHLDSAAGEFRLTTTAGIAIRRVNTQDNAIGVTVPADGRAVILETSILAPPPGSSSFEQAGLWYGLSEDNYAKLVIISRNGTRAHFLHEGAGDVRRSLYGPALLAQPGRITLRMRIDTVSRTVTGTYETAGGAPARMGTWTLPGGLLNSTAGGDPVSRAGLLSSHRLGAQPLLYTFDWFDVRCASVGCSSGPAPVDPAMADRTPPVGEAPGDDDEGGASRPPEVRPIAARPAPVAVVAPAATSSGPAVRASRWLRLGAPRAMTRRALRRRGLRVRVRCSDACRARVGLFTRTTGGRRFGRTPSMPAGRAVVRLAPHIQRRLDGVRRLVLRGRARFDDGTVVTADRRIRLTRRTSRPAESPR